MGAKKKGTSEKIAFFVFITGMLLLILNLVFYRAEGGYRSFVSKIYETVYASSGCSSFREFYIRHYRFYVSYSKIMQAMEQFPKVFAFAFVLIQFMGWACITGATFATGKKYDRTGAAERTAVISGVCTCLYFVYLVIYFIYAFLDFEDFNGVWAQITVWPTADPIHLRLEKAIHYLLFYVILYHCFPCFLDISVVYGMLQDRKEKREKCAVYQETTSGYGRFQKFAVAYLVLAVIFLALYLALETSLISGVDISEGVFNGCWIVQHVLAIAGMIFCMCRY